MKYVVMELAARYAHPAIGEVAVIREGTATDRYAAGLAGRGSRGAMLAVTDLPQPLSAPIGTSLPPFPVRSSGPRHVADC